MEQVRKSSILKMVCYIMIPILVAILRTKYISYGIFK